MSPNEEHPKPTPDSPLFPSGCRVRVRKGTRDPDFPDIPLGGWTGTVTESADSDDGRIYLVEWDAATLKQMHPIFRRRCERDGLEVERTWLEGGDLERDIGEPIEIEQPSELKPRPLDPGEQDDRIRAIFDLTSDDALPKPDLERLKQYHRYLSDNLHFPLDALFSEMESYYPGREEAVRLVGLGPVEQVREENGLLAEIEHAGGRDLVELFDVEVTRNDYARQLLGDYSYWFCEAFHYAVTERPGEEIRLSVSGLPKRESWPVVSVLLRCALYGSLCGAVVGAIVAAIDAAFLAMLVAGGMSAAAGYFLGSRLGFMMRALHLGQYAPVVGGVFGTLLGGVLGVITGPMVVAFPGTVLGSVAGFIVGHTLVKLGLKQAGGMRGGLIGAGAGGVTLAWYINREAAQIGLIYGGVLGAVVGVVLVLLFFASVMWFETRRKNTE